MGLADEATREVTFIGTVKTESATSVHLKVDDSEISLKKDGDTLTGKKKLTVGDTVTVDLRVTGLNGTDWSAQVDVDCPEGDPAKVVSRKGTIGKPDGLGFNVTKKVPGCEQS